MVVIVAAVAPAKPMGTAFTYQGRLNDGGDLADGLYDFAFRLFDEAGGGGQIGPTVQLGHTDVVGGYFTVVLDFGKGAFNGEARWLEVALAPSDVLFKKTVLKPRQAITPVPYAMHLSNAESSPGYVRTIIVSPADTPTDSGQALISAVNSIPDPNEGRVFLVKIEPGVYDLGTDSFKMREYVDIEGSGQNATIITSTAFDNWDTGTIVAVNNAELRNLTVENRGDNLYAICIYISSVSPVISNVTCTLSAEAIGFQQAHVISVRNECYPYLENVTVDLNVMYTVGDIYGLYCFDGARPTLYRCRIFMFSEDTGLMYGVFNFRAAPVLEYTNIVLEKRATSVGLHCEGASPGIPVILRHCDIAVAGFAVALSTEGYWNIDTTGTTLWGLLAEGSAFSGISGAMQHFRLDSNWRSPNLVGGYPPHLVDESRQVYAGNHVMSNYYNWPDIYGCTISGGGGLEPDENHVIMDHYGTIAGGHNNQAGSQNAYVNDAAYATVSGGGSNTASGRGSVVPGGYNNEAMGDYSFAAGQNANALHEGAFVWAGAGPGLTSTAEGQFLANAVGGVGFNDVPPAGGFHVVADSSTQLLTGTTMLLQAGSDISINCGGSSTETVTANRTSTVGGSRTEIIGTNRTSTIGGSHTERIGTNRTIQVGKSADYAITENLTMQVGQKAGISAGDSVLIDTGKSHTSMNKEGDITLSGSHILLQGSDFPDTQRIGTISLVGDHITMQSARKGEKLDLKLGSAPALSGTALVVDAAGKVGVSLSSRRYKTDVRNLQTDADAVLDLQPVRFKYKDSGQEDVGLIAEQVEEHVSDLVIYDNQGRPDAVKYDRLGVYLLEVVKQLKAENNRLKDRIDQLEKLMMMQYSGELE